MESKRGQAGHDSQSEGPKLRDAKGSLRRWVPRALQRPGGAKGITEGRKRERGGAEFGAEWLK